jgi:hypothetical protein
MDALNCPPLWVSFGLNPGGAGAGPWRGWRAVARLNCTPTTPIDDAPPPPDPAAFVAGLGATRPDRGPGGLGVSPPPPLPAAAAGRARRHPLRPRWVAWRVGLTADRFRITGPSGSAPPSLPTGVSWAARGCVLVRRGPTGSADPRASRPGRHCWGRLPDWHGSGWIASRGRLGRASSRVPMLWAVTGPCPRGRQARRKPPERTAGGHVSQAGGRRWSGGGSRGAQSSVSRPTGPERLGPVAVRAWAAARTRWQVFS